MPKMKTVKGALKRFKVKKNNIKRGSAFRRHILTKKDSQKMRNLKSPKTVHPTNVTAIKKQLCMA
ncbi:MAG: large subunit ribosomal protein [Campylobacterota bacterium]|nr:large subunit ribosomal protein [Campylobacterota bacterium]